MSELIFKGPSTNVEPILEPIGGFDETMNEEHKKRYIELRKASLNKVALPFIGINHPLFTKDISCAIEAQRRVAKEWKDYKDDKTIVDYDVICKSILSELLQESHFLGSDAYRSYAGCDGTNIYVWVSDFVLNMAASMMGKEECTIAEIVEYLYGNKYRKEKGYVAFKRNSCCKTNWDNIALSVYNSWRKHRESITSPKDANYACIFADAISFE